MSRYRCGVNVQSPLTLADIDSLKRFSWALMIVAWDDRELVAMQACLQVAALPIRVIRFTEDPRDFTGWPQRFMAGGRYGLFANETDLEGWPSWYQPVTSEWLAEGGQLAEPAFHDESKYENPYHYQYAAVTAHCYASDFANLAAVRARAGDRRVLVTEYAHEGQQQACLKELAAAGVNPADVALFAFRWSGAGSQPGFDLVDITLEDPNMAVDPKDPIIVDILGRLDAQEKRIADFTVALRDVVEGKYQGAAGAAGQVVALEGGNDANIQPQSDVSPKA